MGLRILSGRFASFFRLRFKLKKERWKEREGIIMVTSFKERLNLGFMAKARVMLMVMVTKKIKRHPRSNLSSAFRN